MSSPRADPYHYTPPQIAHLLSGHLPPPVHAAFTHTLLANHVDGETLLTMVTYERLQSDLGLDSMGLRGRVLRVVEELRRRSPLYREYVSKQGSNSNSNAYAPLAEEEEEEEQQQQRPIQHLSLPSPPRGRRGENRPPLPPLQEYTLVPFPISSSSPPSSPPQLPQQQHLPAMPPLSLLDAPADDPLVVNGAAALLTAHTAIKMVRRPSTGEIVAVPITVSHHPLPLPLPLPSPSPSPEAGPGPEPEPMSEVEDSGMQLVLRAITTIAAPPPSPPPPPPSGSQRRIAPTTIAAITSAEEEGEGEGEAHAREASPMDVAAAADTDPGAVEVVVETPLPQQQRPSGRRRRGRRHSHYLPARGVPVDRLV